MLSEAQYAQSKVRIFLANRPRMVRQMLRRAIQRTPNLKVVGESEQDESIVDAPRWLSIDWLVVSLTERGEIPGQFLDMVRHHPSLRLLGISQEGDQLELRDYIAGEERHMHNVSLEVLIAIFQKRRPNQPSP